MNYPDPAKRRAGLRSAELREERERALVDLRCEVHGKLAARGHSCRRIARITGYSKSTVAADLLSRPLFR